MGCPKLHILKTDEPLFKVSRKIDITQKTRVVDFWEYENLGIDYYPFGMLMPGRNGGSGEYRYGMNGQENDDEIKGEGNSQSYRFRMADPRLGRFFAVDPLAPNYPELTPYQFASNTPIWAMELEGLEAYIATNEAAKVMSNEDYREFVQKTAQKMVNAKDVEENRYDCADFCITVLAKYYKERGVRFKYKIGERTIDSNDPNYSGPTAWDDFLEDLKKNASADNLRRSNLTTEVRDAHMQAGDLINSGGHTQIYLGVSDNPNQPVKSVQASGAYYGKGNPENETILPEYATYSNFWAQGYRWNFLYDLPERRMSTLTRVEPIKASPINIENKSPSLSIPKDSSTGSGQSGKGNRRARRRALRATRKKL